MLDDRSYMREPSPLPPPARTAGSATITILIINAVVFLGQLTLTDSGADIFSQYFALSWDTLKRGMIWQLVTFQFLHGGWLHLLFNSLGIYMFGRDVEERLGRLTFVKLYLISGVVGGFVHVLGSWILPGNFGGLHSSVVGASAGVYGLVAAFAVLYPQRKITLLVFYIVPVTLTARVMFFGAAALAVFGIIFPQGNVAEGAHLGGLIYGWICTKALLRSDWHLPPIIGAPNTNRNSAPPLIGIRSNDFISREVDPILDKISAQGMQSLTEAERQILLKAARDKETRR